MQIYPHKETLENKISSIPKEQEKAINKAREIYYHLFGVFFIYGELEKQYTQTISLLEQIALNPMNEENKKDISDLIDELKTHQAKNIASEFEEQFIDNFNTKAIQLSMSYYDEGHTHGQIYLLTKQIIKKTHYRRDESFVETEDELGFLCLFGAILLNSQEEGSTEILKELFEKIINPYVNYIIVEILKSPSAVFYKMIARLLSSFMEFERLYLDVSPQKYCEFIDKAQALREERSQKFHKRNKSDITLEEIQAKET